MPWYNGVMDVRFRDLPVGASFRRGGWDSRLYVKVGRCLYRSVDGRTLYFGFRRSALVRTAPYELVRTT